MHVFLNSALATLRLRPRNVVLGAILAAASLSAAATEPVATPKTIAVMNFELIDNTGEASKEAEQAARLALISQQLRKALAEHRLYTVVDNAPAQSLITDLESRFSLHDCNGCDVEIGRALNADRVLTGWVQKVSNLILNINIQIRDVQSEKIVLNKSVDIRGNNDDTWRRGIRYMIRSMVDNGQGNS